MVVSLVKRLPLRAALSGAALLALVGLSARGQSLPPVSPPMYAPPYTYGPGGYPLAPMYAPPPAACPVMPAMPIQPYFCPPHPCLPGPVQPAQPAQTAPPSATQPQQPSTTPETQPQQPSTTPEQSQTPTQAQNQNQGQDQSGLSGERGAAGDTGNVAMGTNIMGDLLGATNSVAFFYERSSGNVFLQGQGSTSLIVPKVAENNSPIPRDRVGFRYNYFNNSQSITGDSGQAAFAPGLGVSQANSAPRFQGETTTRSFDVNQFTFAYEKTFWNGWGSLEMRLPFSYTVGQTQNLSIANPVLGNDTDDGTFSNGIVGTVPTPQNTLGAANMEIGNMLLIFKGLAYQSSRLYVSGGAAVNVPTARATHVTVTDYLGDYANNDTQVQRMRDFVVTNETWSLSPYLAALYFPTNRWFTQGFLQTDVPLNKSRVIYSEIPTLNNEPTELQFNGITTQQRIREQTLLNVDIGTGYYAFIRDPREKAWLTAFAPQLELHYTTTLNDADIVALPVAPKGMNLVPVGPNGLRATEPNPQVGNLRNRVDIFDITVGGTFVVANRATIATGFAFPLSQGDNRTFDWEFQLQLNYYFGGFLGYRPRIAPNVF